MLAWCACVRANAESNNDEMKFDVVLCSMGTSYKGYCSNMSRTILIDPPTKVPTERQP